MNQPTVLLVGERDLLATIATGGGGYETEPRTASAETGETAARAAGSGAGTVIVFDPQPGELEAIGDAGVQATAWDRDWFPVADELFVEGEPPREPSRVFFSGPTSERRDRYLQPAKHRFDVLHLAGGASRAELTGLMDRCTIAIDLEREPGLPLVDRTGPAMARSMLVVSERGAPRDGLEDWQQLVTFDTPDELELTIADAIREPEAFLDVRRRGRAAAEAWRSSVAIPRFLAETGS